MANDGEIAPGVTEWKLADVPELGYFTTDKPFPRGELLIKTKTMIDGYYKHQDVSHRPSPCFESKSSTDAINITIQGMSPVISQVQKL